MRVFFLTSTPPIPSWGGAMAFYRHFCERPDFKISVATNNPDIFKYEVPYQFSYFSTNKIWQRIVRTRLNRWIYSSAHLTWGNVVPSQIVKQAIDFKPDVVLTVAGSWSWTTRMAGVLAKKLKIPLVGSFNDWWYYNLIYHPATEKWIERSFRKFYQKCDLALCTSEGMRDELGPHKNAIVFYPSGALRPALIKKTDKTDKIFTVAFAGNIGEWYGKMLESLITLAKDNIKFRIFGNNPNWSDEFLARATQSGIYRGHIAFEELRQEMLEVDVLLLPMGFDESSAQIERTSFKTKFLDYLSFSKPILVWGPEYCSAVRTAKEFDSAEICTDQDSKTCMENLVALRENPERRQQIVNNAQRMYESRFHPDKIHQLLVDAIGGLITQCH